MSNELKDLTSLGKSKATFTGLETFPTPPNVKRVTFVSDEVTANCPITNQPDWYVVKVEYIPIERCVESKTIKLYLHNFRNQGHFCEKFASIIAQDMMKALEASLVTVTVTQKSRGGVSIISEAEIGSNDIMDKLED